MSPRVIFRLLGPWALQVDDRLLPKPATLKAQSLLGYLLMHPNVAQPREKLAGLFWPDADDDRGQRSLRTALWSLRRMLEAGWPTLAEALATTRFDVRWVPMPAIEIDAHMFETAVMLGLDQRRTDAKVALAALETAASHYRGPLLEGLYDDWCLNERYRLEERCLQVLQALVAGYEAAGRLRDGVAAAQRLLDMDPLREEIHRVAIRMLGALGDRAGAARQFKRCAQVLQDGLGIEPDAETAAAYAATRVVGTGSPRRQAAADAAPDLPAASTSTAGSGLRPLPEGSRTPLIGRQVQWEALVGWLSAAERGTGHALLVAAPAGYGKTRLLEEVAARARWRSARVLWGRCYEYERLLPYQPFAEALRSGMQPNPTIVVGDDLRGQVPGDASGASDAAALAALPAIWKQALVMLLPDWADRLEPDGSPAPRPGAEQSQVLEAISRLLQALARHQPLLLVIDDLHWAAESTLQLFHHIARGIANHPILLVGTYRPEDLVSEAGQQHPLPRVTRSLQALGALDILQLDPLGPEHVLELVSTMAGVPAGQPHTGLVGTLPTLTVLAERLHRYAEGNPLFILAAIDALRTGGMIREVAEANGVRWQIADALLAGGDLALPLPAQIRELLEERLDRVSPEAREIARLAAVAGSEFDLAILERVCGRSEDETLQAIDALLSARFFREGGSRGARDFSFTHHLYKELIYDSLPKAARSRHHRRIAEAMEEVYGPQALASELVLHFVRGELPLRALPYACVAGKRAASSYANDDALQYYSLALALLTEARDTTPPDQRLQLDVQRIDVLDARLALYRRLGRPREEDADVREMLDGARAIGDRRRELLALVQRSSSLGRAGDTGGSLEDARAALALAGGLEDAGSARDIRLDLTSRAQAALGWALLLHDAYAEALNAFWQALVGYRALKQVVPPEDRGAAQSGEAVTLGNIGWTHEHTGAYAAARRCYEEALAIYQAVGDRLGEANTTVYLGNICWFDGDLAQAQSRYEAALALFEPIIYRRGEATCLRNLGLTYGRRGRLETALAYHRRALALHEALEDPAGVAECRLAIADCHYLIGLHAEALAGYERALELSKAAENKHGEAQSVFGLARVDRAQGRPERALSRSTDIRPLCLAIRYSRGVAWCDREAGLANLALGNPGEASALLRAALDGFVALGEPSMRIATEADLAAAYLAQGTPSHARPPAEAAAGAIRAGDHGVDQPQSVLFVLARTYRAVGDLAAGRQALTEAVAEVRAQALRLDDPALRASFLKNVPINRAIFAATLDDDFGASAHAVV